MLNKNFVKLAIPVAVGALALTACGGGKDDNGKSGGKPTFSIGFQGPLSGDNSALGINENNGVKLAVEEANAKGDLPFTLKVADGDDQGLPDQAPAAAQKLIGDSSVVAVVGPAFSGPTKATGGLYAQAQLAAVSSSATNPELTSQGFTSFLRGAPNDNEQGAGMAEYLTKKEKVKKVFVIDDKSEYGVGLAKVAIDGLKAAGVTVETDSVPAKTPDYTAAATKVVNSKSDALVYAGYYADLAPFAKKLADGGFKGIGISGDGANDAKFVELAGAAADKWFLTCPCTDATKNESTKAFTEAYTKKFNTAPGTYSAESYDIANLVISEMKKLGKDVTREKLLAALKGVSYEGLTKTFSFDDKGELKIKNVYLYQVADGKIGYLGDVATLSNG
ncbi:branched-chain amino acid ABC transporter substrate-binding protein [Streptomyces sp. ME01-24h]|nr:branched-chain amino acid ABC transporter substrate-binding protein [Streptomyces sp. ME19-03-3]MDX3355623.1 branched-chain amino acid ABC transporter substrate-binding protein [Streptomyces sp. ME01-24h]